MKHRRRRCCIILSIIVSLKQSCSSFHETCFIKPVHHCTRYCKQLDKQERLVATSTVSTKIHTQLSSTRNSNSNRRHQNDGRSRTRQTTQQQSKRRVPPTDTQKAIWFNKEIIQLGKSQNWEDMLTRFAEEEQKGYLNNVNYATIISQCAKINANRYQGRMLQNSPKFRFFLKRLSEELDDKGFEWFGCRSLTSIIYSIAKTNLRNDYTKTIILRMVQNKNDSFTSLYSQSIEPQAIANTVWAFATLGIQYSSLFHEVDKRAEWLVQNGTTQAISNTVWAFATLGVQPSFLLQEVDKRAEWFLQNGSAQAIANTVWAFGTLGVQSTLLFKEVDRRSDWLVQNGTTQDIANTVWAFATLGVKPTSLLHEVDKRAEWLVQNGNEQDIANAVWAFATLGVQPSFLLQEVDKRAEWLVQNGSAQGIANTVWAFATLGVQPSLLFKEVEKRAEWLVQNGKPQDIANTVWAFATLGVQPSILLQEIDKRAEWLVQNGNAMDIANTAWAFATLGIKPFILLQEVDNRAEWLVQNGSAQAVANTVWAFATVCYDSSDLFQAVSKNMNFLLPSINSKQASSLLYAFIISNNFDTLASSASLLLNKALEFPDNNLNSDMTYWGQLSYIFIFAIAHKLDCRASSKPLVNQKQSITSKPKISHFHGKVSHLLKSIGFQHESEMSPCHQVTNGMLSIDLANKECMIAIECDGPSHFVRLLSDEHSYIENGRTCSKRRILEKLGWRVVNIPYYQYDRLNDLQRKVWLTAKLRVAGWELRDS